MKNGTLREINLIVTQDWFIAYRVFFLVINLLGDLLSEHQERLSDASSTSVISTAERYESKIDNFERSRLPYAHQHS
jgi:hypothetical protein